MKVIYATQQDGSRMLIGLKPSSFNTAEWANEKADALQKLNFTGVVEESPLESLSVNELVDLTSEMIAELRKRLDEPKVVQYASDIGIEVRPITDDNRVLVLAKDRGDTVVNYQADGLALDVFPEHDIDPVSSTWFDNADLADPAKV